MSYPVLGLAGGSGVGKDAAAKILLAEGWKRVAFADPVRRMALAIDPLVPIEYSHTTRLSNVVRDRGWEGAKKVVEVRRLLQSIGTEAVRDIIGEDTWVELAVMAIEQAESPVVVTDVRFENEAQALRAMGGQICMMSRPGSHCEVDHRSEHLTITPDFFIDNSGTIGDLDAAIRNAVDHEFVGLKIG